MKLYNHLSAKENSLIIDKSQDYRITLSFYKYVFIGNPQIFRNYLFEKLNNLDVLGRIFVANEGINAQLSFPEKNLSLFKKMKQNQRNEFKYVQSEKLLYFECNFECFFIECKIIECLF